VAKVNITKANFNLIIKSMSKINNPYTRNLLATEILKDISDKDFFSDSDLLELFNTKELQYLYNVKIVMNDFKLFLSTLKNDRELVTNYVNSENLKYLKNVKAPAYHSTNSCRWISSDFENIKIKEGVIDDRDLKLEINAWIKNNKLLDFESLNTAFIEKFNIIEGLEKVNLQNSGNTLIENNSVGSYLHLPMVKETKQQLQFLFNSEISKKIGHYRYAPKPLLEQRIKEEQNKQDKQSLLSLQEAKENIKNIIFSKLRVQYDMQDFSFEQVVLDKIGFRSCKSCIHSIKL